MKFVCLLLALTGTVYNVYSIVEGREHPGDTTKPKFSQQRVQICMTCYNLQSAVNCRVIPDRPKENYKTLSEKCFIYKAPIYFIQQNDFFFSHSPTEGKSVDKLFGKTGSGLHIFRRDSEKTKLKHRRWVPVDSYLFRVPSHSQSLLHNPLNEKISDHLE